VGLPENCINNYIHQFSGGQKQRLAIARALAVEPAIIVADEPVSSLDLSIQAQILNLMKDIKDNNSLTYVIISHDLAVISNMADNIMVLKDGGIVEAGPTYDIITTPEDPYTKKLLNAVPQVAI